jgi:hypothetical protein
MITDQFNPDRYPADIRLAIPHADAGMVSLILFVQDSIRAPVSSDHIMGVATVSALTAAQLFSS